MTAFHRPSHSNSRCHQDTALHSHMLLCRLNAPVSAPTPTIAASAHLHLRHALVKSHIPSIAIQLVRAVPIPRISTFHGSRRRHLLYPAGRVGAMVSVCDDLATGAAGATAGADEGPQPRHVAPHKGLEHREAVAEDAEVDLDGGPHGGAALGVENVGAVEHGADVGDPHAGRDGGSGAHDEDQPHGDLLLPGHLQAPQRHDGHDDEHGVGADVEDGLGEGDVVEAGGGAGAERVAGLGEDDGEDEGVDDAGERDGVEDAAVGASRVDAVVQHDEGELDEGGRPEVGDAEEEEHILIALHPALCYAPEMLAEAAGHDFDHGDEGGEIYCPCCD